MRQVAPVSTRSAWVPDRWALEVLFWSVTVPLAIVRAVPVEGWKFTLFSVSVASPSAWMVAGMVMVYELLVVTVPSNIFPSQYHPSAGAKKRSMPVRVLPEP